MLESYDKVLNSMKNSIKSIGKEVAKHSAKKACQCGNGILSPKTVTSFETKETHKTQACGKIQLN